jgi:hypothetical protein
MNLAEYHQVEHQLESELHALARWCADHGRTGPEAAPIPGRPETPAGGADGRINLCVLCISLICS